MATGKLFIGRKVRELRLSTNATQVQFAERLGISTSYLNHIESNQRPVSATVLIALMDKFKMDFSELASGETDRLLSALSETLDDPIFEGYSPSLQELKLITHNAPGFAHALIACHQAYRTNSEQLVSLDREVGRGLNEVTPYEEVRDFFHFVDNYIHDIDVAAEALAKSLNLLADPRSKLMHWLENEYKMNIGFGPADAPLRDLDHEHRRITLNGFAAPQTQTFQLAVALAQLAVQDSITTIIESASFRTQEARDICRVGLHNYFAGALLMPYGDFLESARLLRHDIELLALKFGTSLEQVCHRLSTLQRPNNKGIPIFFARIDRAGNITKRHSATKLQFARFGAACPLWNAHQAFETPGRILRQLAETPDGVRYLSIATQVGKGVVGFHADRPVYALALGCESTYADAFVYADGLNLSDRSDFEPIGISCRICERTNCASRTMPPLKRRLSVNHGRRGLLAYELK
ncbi:helix-turn-helix domain-containing protein [Rhizobium sp. SYY.PMSO]|uniref:helix-turn-helix domain-containing protein n=1 Tax=Rhizobium sp. SYY.PMSO TaxID=3382192 RepID=UPI0039901AB7